MEQAGPDLVGTIRTTVKSMNDEGRPVSIPKLQAEIIANSSQYNNLSRNQIRRILRITGHVYGSAAHHHVDKESAANMKYRAVYIIRKKTNRGKTVTIRYHKNKKEG